MNPTNYSGEASGFDWASYWDGGIDHVPRAPMLRSRNVVLPADTDTENDGTSIVTGAEEILPEHLLFMPGHLKFSRRLDPRLAYTEERRSVLEPLRFQISGGEYLLWGTAITVSEEAGGGIELDSLEDSEKRVAPATNPPVAMLWIATEDDAIIQIKPRPGMGFVAVVDVQEAVIHWMEESRDEREASVPTSGDRSSDHDRQDSRWMWHGLLPLGQRLDAWELRC